MTSGTRWIPPAHLERHALLLRAALGDRDSALAAYTTWASGFSAATALDRGEFAILSAVAINLTRHGIALDDEIGMRVRGTSRRTWTSNALHLTSARDATNAMESVGTAVAVHASGLSVLMEFNDVGVVPLDHIELWVPAAHAPRAVAALVAIGAATESALEPYLDERAGWQAKFFATFKGIGILLRWDPEQDAALATTTATTLGTHTFSAVSVGDRILGYLSRITSIPSAGSPLGSADGGGTDVSEGVIAALGLSRALQIPADEQWAVARSVADRAHRADRHGEFIGVLSWLTAVDPRPEVTRFSTVFERTPQPRSQAERNGPLLPPRPGPAFALARRFVDHARLYRDGRYLEHTSPTAFGFGRYLVGRTAQRLRRAVDR